MNPDSHTHAIQGNNANQTVIRITAEPVLIPYLEKLITAFTPIHPSVQVVSQRCHEASAFSFLINDRSSMALIEREITPTEAVPYKKQRGTRPFALQVAISVDPPTLYVHHSNPLVEISAVQLSQIFTQGNPQGDFSGWEQVPGAQKSGNLCPLSLPEDSTLQTYMQKHHFAGRELSARTEYATDSESLLKKLENTPNGIGIAEYGIENPKLRAVKLAEPATPLTRFLHLYLPLDASGITDSASQKFADFLLSDAGQAIIATSAFTPLHPGELSQQRALLSVHS